ncbi:C39 family peptidase [Patescibacteria group bacterium]
MRKIRRKVPKIPLRWSRKIFIFLGGGGVVAVASLFAYSYYFRQSPPLEEKFVVEPLPFDQTLPLPTSEKPGHLEKKVESPVELIQPGQTVLLSGTRVAYQSFNNCGPANLSMILSYYGISKTQKELAEQLRPYRHPQGDNDDKTVFPQEFVDAVEDNGLRALYRPNGSLQLIKLFLANDIPVVVKTLLKKTEDSAHFRVVRGFDEEKQVMIVDDSYFGPNKKISYFDFLSMWQPFGYVYMPVYREGKDETIQAILGSEIDPEVAYWRLINRSQKEIEKDPQSIWPKFNLVNSYYRVGQLEKCVEEFEKIEFDLPRRALWYQIEPILAYQKLENYDRVFEIIEQVLNDGNRAFSELYQIRGEIFLDQGEKVAAKNEFQRALEYNSNFLPAKKALSGLAQ